MSAEAAMANEWGEQQDADRKSTRLKLQSLAYLVCRLLLEKKKICSGADSWRAGRGRSWPCARGKGSNRAVSGGASNDSHGHGGSLAGGAVGRQCGGGPEC